MSVQIGQRSDQRNMRATSWVKRKNSERSSYNLEPVPIMVQDFGKDRNSVIFKLMESKDEGCQANFD